MYISYGSSTGIQGETWGILNTETVHVYRYILSVDRSIFDTVHAICIYTAHIYGM